MECCPKISIVTVCFNSMENIEQTILSVMNQTYKNIEYIIIDGKSTDGTVNIIGKYQEQLAYWVSEPDTGIYDAMNKGIEVASGEYIFFLNAGDYLMGDVFCQIENMLCKNYDFIYGKAYIRNVKKIYGQYFNKYLIGLRNICHQAILYRRCLLVEMGGFALQYPILADWEFNIRCFAKDRVKKIYVDIVFTNYEGNGISETSYDKNFETNRLQIVYKELGIGAFFIVFFKKIVAAVLKNSK